MTTFLKVKLKLKVNLQKSAVDISDTPYILQRLEGWIRRRLRMCLWKQWKKICTKYRNLIKLSLPDWAALNLANTRKAYWHIAGDSLNSCQIPIGLILGL